MGTRRTIVAPSPPRAAAPVLIVSDPTADAVAYLTRHRYHLLDAGNGWYMVLPPGFGSQGELLLAAEVRALAAEVRAGKETPDA